MAAVKNPPNGSISIASTIEQQILSLTDALKVRDVASYDGIVANLVQNMSSAGKRELVRSLRSPQNAVGALQDHPLWPDINEAIEHNRRMDSGEPGAD